MPQLTRVKIQANLLELFDREITQLDDAVPVILSGVAAQVSIVATTRSCAVKLRGWVVQAIISMNTIEPLPECARCAHKMPIKFVEQCMLCCMQCQTELDAANPPGRRHTGDFEY